MCSSYIGILSKLARFRAVNYSLLAPKWAGRLLRAHTTLRVVAIPRGKYVVSNVVN